MLSCNFGRIDSLEGTKNGVKMVQLISPTTTFETTNSQ